MFLQQQNYSLEKGLKIFQSQKQKKIFGTAVSGTIGLAEANFFFVNKINKGKIWRVQQVP